MEVAESFWPVAEGSRRVRNEMKPGYLRIASSVAAFFCAAAAVAALYWLYSDGRALKLDPIFVMPAAGVVSGAFAGLGVGVLMRRYLACTAIGAICLWPIVVIGVLLCLPAR
jgi:hypothetical protein